MDEQFFGKYNEENKNPIVIAYTMQCCLHGSESLFYIDKADRERDGNLSTPTLLQE